MTTCYEYLRKKTQKDQEIFHRLNSYFISLENDDLENYHKKRGRK